MQYYSTADHQLVVTHSASSAKFAAMLVLAMGIAAAFFAASDLYFFAIALAFIIAGVWLRWRAPSAHHTFSRSDKSARLTWRSELGWRRELRVEFAQITDVIVAETKFYDEDKMYRIELLLLGGRRVPLTPYWLPVLAAVEACAREVRRLTNEHRA